MITKSLAVAIGGALGCLLRWLFANLLNPLFLIIPFGTLFSNLVACYLIGIMVGLLKVFPLLPETLRLGIIPGFLGGLSTLSTFAAETVHFLSTRSYLLAGTLIMAHVGGGIIMTILGVFSIKLILKAV